MEVPGELGQILQEVRNRVDGLEDSPARKEALESLNADAGVLHGAAAGTPEEMLARAERVDRAAVLGARVGLGLGLALSGGLVAAALISGETSLLQAGLLAVTGGTISSLVLRYVGFHAGRDLAGWKIQNPEVGPVVQRWMPVVRDHREREAEARESLAQVGRMAGSLQNGQPSGVSLTDGGLMVGGVFLRQRPPRRE